QRLGGEQVHGARALVAHEQVEHGEVVAQRLAAGSRGDDDYVLAGYNPIEGVGLVGIQARNPAFGEGGAQLRVDERRNIGERSLRGWLMMDGPNGRIRLQM